MTQQEADRLKQRLISFGSSLTPEQNVKFREILDDFAQIYYDVGEMYKMACIALIPSKIQSSNQSVQAYTPTAKQAVKGDLLGELRQNVSMITDKDQLKSLIQKLQQEKK